MFFLRLTYGISGAYLLHNYAEKRWLNKFVINLEKCSSNLICSFKLKFGKEDNESLSDDLDKTKMKFSFLPNFSSFKSLIWFRQILEGYNKLEGFIYMGFNGVLILCVITVVCVSLFAVVEC
jgi:hypothetical protein